MNAFHSTTVLAVRRDGKLAMGGDGQVTMSDQKVKQTARKIRPLAGGRVLVGFAGGAADSFALMERFESKLEAFPGNLVRAATELAKEWRMDRALRRLESLMAVADAEHMLLLSGSGDLIEPDEAVLAIGSGGGYARAAATALLEQTDLPAPEIVRKGLETAARICVYTNDHITVETL